MSGWEAAAGRLGAGAEWYAGELGWKVFPVFGLIEGRCACGATHDSPKDHGKHPNSRLVSEGMKAATSDTERIKEWWRREPESNLGVRCRESGFLVVDIDPRSGGEESYYRLEELVEGELPATVEALTGGYETRTNGVRRGRHLFYRVDEGESLKGNLAKDGLSGIDLKHNGYVLIAPSRHASGVCYEWVEGKAPWEREIARASEQLLAVVRKRAPALGGSWGWVGDLEWRGRRLDLEALLEEGVDEGRRAVAVYEMTCSIANRNGSDAFGQYQTETTMVRFNQEQVRPPLPLDGTGGLLGHVRNAMRFIKEHPKVDSMWDGELLSEYKKAAGALLTRGEEEKGGGGGGGADAVRVEEGEGAAGSALLKLPEDIDEALRVSTDEAVLRRSPSETGNGRRFADYFGETTCCSTGLGWFCWNGEYWAPDPGVTTVKERAKILPSIIAREAMTYEDENKQQELMKLARATKSNAMIAAAIESARTDPRIDVAVETWDSNDVLLGVRNGVVDLRTGELLKGKPEHHITKRSQVAYTQGMQNVRFEQFLDFATGGDKELQDWLQRAAGYTLTGLRTYDLMFLVYGPPGSGKNTLVEALVLLLDNYAYPMDAEILMDRRTPSGTDMYHWAELRGKRMVWVDELPESERMKEPAVKRLTGSYVIEARSPGEKPFSFKSRAKLWCSTNHRPIIIDDAMWRRMRPIPFMHVPERPDPNLKPYIFDPEGGLPAVLAWAVNGAVKLLSSGERDALGWCKAVWEAADMYRKSEDRLGIFLGEETRENPGAEIPITTLYPTYRVWCDARGEKSMTTIALMRKLQDRGETLLGTGTRAILVGRALIPRSVENEGPDWGSLVSRVRS